MTFLAIGNKMFSQKRKSRLLMFFLHIGYDPCNGGVTPDAVVPEFVFMDICVARSAVRALFRE